MELWVVAVLLQDPDVEKLIEQLPAPEAHRKLVELGRKAIPTLQKSKDRARTKPVIVEIRRNERKDEIRRLLSPGFLAEAPEVPDLLASEKSGDWLKLIRRCAGVAVLDGTLVRSARVWYRATTEDLVLFLRLYLDGGLRDDTVEGLLYWMADSFRLPLPEFVVRARGAYALPSVIRPAWGEFAGTLGAPRPVTRFWTVDEYLAGIVALESAARFPTQASVDFLRCASGDLDPRIRRAAARFLLRFDIVLWEVLDEDRRHPDQSWEMNRLCKSDLFDRIERTALKDRRHAGTVLELATAWSKETGIRIETELEEPCEIRASTLADALRQIVDRFRVVLIERDRIRIVPVYEAEERWQRLRRVK